METQYEFGKATQEVEMERIARHRKNTRRALTFGALLTAVVLIFAFRNNIQGVLSSSEGNENTEKIAGEKKKKDALALAPVDITRQWELPSELLEISGLSWMDADRLACIQDEEAIVFVYNIRTSSVEKKIPFGSVGDYEGLALVGESAWVIRSDGKLFEINPLNGKPAVKEYDTPLTAAHNSEGLCYDKKNNRLLIALKDGEPGKTGRKGIYSFDLATKKMSATPVMELDMATLFAGTKVTSKKKNEAPEFMPSAISIHPVSGDIYITEGRKPRLLILDQSGAVKKLYQLEKSSFNQPEGITFSPTGDMYISNEGSKQPGNILHVTLNEK